MKQGDLSDPNYFDFICFSQLFTIESFIRKPYKVFNEPRLMTAGLSDFEIEENKQKTIFRTSDDGTLYDELFQGIGQRILLSLRNGFEEQNFEGVPKMCDLQYSSTRTTMECIVPGIRELLTVLVRYGYAASSRVVEARKPGTNDESFSIVTTMIGSASMWASQSLFSRGCTCHACYENMIVGAFLREAHVYDYWNVEASTIVSPEAQSSSSIWKFSTKMR